jgi:galactokinase
MIAFSRIFVFLAIIFAWPMALASSAMPAVEAATTESHPISLFVPGRLCLFGEHSDWAGEYRVANPEIGIGKAIVTTINQGIHAYVKPNNDKFIYTVASDIGNEPQSIEIPMDDECLLTIAQSNTFYNKVAGVALQMLRKYGVRGAEFENDVSDLPIQKGLSSSACSCILVARGFNKIYNLGLSINEEMEIAYLGERVAGSPCGRMDQVCALGNTVALMNFDEDRVTIVPLLVGEDVHLIIVDLKKKKNTAEIINALKKGFPFPRNREEEDIKTYLGPINAAIVRRARLAFRQGNNQELGALMTHAQQLFDLYMAPACPSQLQAPVLHAVLNYGPIQSLIYGGKGCGSQGDGSAQIIVRSEKAGTDVINLLKQAFDVDCIQVKIKKTTKI